MVSDLKTFAHKGCKIAGQQKVSFLANFALLAGFFWYRCYYPHQSRDSLSPVCGIFLFSFNSIGSDNITKHQVKKKTIFNIYYAVCITTLQDCANINQECDSRHKGNCNHYKYVNLLNSDSFLHSFDY